MEINNFRGVTTDVLAETDSLLCTGSVQGFVFDKSLPEAVAKELAWSSFALLRNTNSCSVVIVKNGSVVMARGVLGVNAMDAASPKESLPQLTKTMKARSVLPLPTLKL